jgi:Inner membrane protein YgaP-like, transmembrane domain
MKTNEGGFDRLLRIIVGAALLLGVFFGSNFGLGWLNPWGWIGVVPLATGLIGWCPAYAILGIKTCPMQSHK